MQQNRSDHWSLVARRSDKLQVKPLMYQQYAEKVFEEFSCEIIADNESNMLDQHQDEVIDEAQQERDKYELSYEGEVTCPNLNMFEEERHP